MATTITINDTLILDQSSGLQDDDTLISNDLTGLSTAFKDFLLGLPVGLALSTDQLDYADDVEAAVSAAGLVTVNPDGATISQLFFSDSSGAPLDGDQVFFNGDPLQTVDGDTIYFHSYENGTIVLATTSATEGAGDVVAAFYLNAASDNLGASIEMVTFEAIAHPDTGDSDDRIDWTDILNVSATGSTSFNFDNLASGNHLFVAVGTTDVGLVVSGLHPVIQADGTLANTSDNIKTSQGGTGATIGINNQMFDPLETGVFSLVSGQAPGTFGDIDNMNYNDFVDVSDATIFISQTQGSPNTNFTLTIGAFSAGGAGTDPEDLRSYIDNDLGSGSDLGQDPGDSALADDAPVAILRVVVRDENGQIVTDTTTSNSFVTFNADGTATVQGLNSQYTVQWFTDDSGTLGIETFNRFQVTGVVGKFDIGRVDISQGLTTTESVGDSLFTDDDGPTITVPFDGDQNGVPGTHETLANTLNASATGDFGYDIGTDAHLAAFYTGGGSDFVDQDGVLAGVQIGLNGTITGGGGGNILTSEVTLASESLTAATFDFSFTYDKDPAAGVQTGTAGGTLDFDKVAGTYTITLTDPLEGFSFNILHTSELLSKEPTSNVGHPPIVVEKLDEDFYVQFTANLINKANPFSLTPNGEGSSADSAFTVGGHEMVSNANETWVSATQSTNGVAGDTIQKGELLTLRFFNSDVGIASEATDPTATAGAIAIKFDGIGNSEDLMLILDLVDNGADNIFGTTDDTSITRAVYVSNDDIFRTGQVPAPYSSEFTLDNNDGLVIIEQNDYNAAGEEYLLQGVQIMQSGNGITGNNTAIDLIGATGAGGGSLATTNLVNFDAADNDVLKIVDIGFSTTVTETPDADLDFFFQVADADADQTAMQHILVDIA